MEDTASGDKEMTADVLLMLARMYAVSIVVVNDNIDPAKTTGERAYCDGYADGVRAVAKEIRAAIERECPDFQARLARAVKI